MMGESPRDGAESEVIAAGKHLRLMSCGGWEYVERSTPRGVVAIAAVVDGGFLLTEQYRPPVEKPVIDLAAGLVGDGEGQEEETFAAAALRELEEETGCTAGGLELLAACPTSPGLTNETVLIYEARDVRRVSAGGGDSTEQITVHEVPLAGIDEWLREQVATGKLVDPKVYAALYLCGRR